MAPRHSPRTPPALYTSLKAAATPACWCWWPTAMAAEEAVWRWVFTRNIGDPNSAPATPDSELQAAHLKVFSITARGLH